MLTMEDKIILDKDVPGLVQKLRDDGKKIITTNGGFDLSTYGHSSLFEYIKKYSETLEGDYILIVGVNSDQSVKDWKKNYLKKKDWDERPIIPEKERAAKVADSMNVDYVVIYDSPLNLEFLKWVKPDIHFTSDEYAKGNNKPPEFDVVNELGAELKYFPRVESIMSTSQIIEKIKKLS